MLLIKLPGHGTTDVAAAKTCCNACLMPTQTRASEDHGANMAPNTAKKITANAPGWKYSARVENFRELIPIPAITLEAVFNAKFMGIQLSANWSGRPVNLMIMPG